MRKLFTILVALLLTATVLAQSPQKMSYQAVIRDAGDNLVTNQTVGMRITILQGNASGTEVYTETQTPTTNANGLISIEIGGEVGFNSIDWANDIYFIKTEIDPEGGSIYTITGTSQLLSVPYALHAKTVDTITETDPSVPTGTAAGQMQYWNGTEWVIVATTTNEGATLQMIGGVPTWTGGTSTTPNVINPITGKTWMDRNLGASQVASSSSDEASFGDLYQWGRGTDGHQIRTSDITTTLSNSDTPGHADFIINSSSSTHYDWRSPQNNNLWQGVSGTNNPCPSGYRLPTEVEMEAERTSWSSSNSAGAFASPLKLPVAIARDGFYGGLYMLGSGGYYWSSTIEGAKSRYLFFSSSTSDTSFDYRANGFSVRCIKD